MDDIHRFYAAKDVVRQREHAKLIVKELYQKRTKLIDEPTKALVFMLGLVLRALKEETLDNVFEEHLQYLPHWLLVPALWYCNRPVARKWLKKTTVHRDPHVRLLGKVFHRRAPPIPPTNPSKHRNVISNNATSNRELKLQHAKEVWMNWCVSGDELYVQTMIEMVGRKTIFDVMLRMDGVSSSLELAARSGATLQSQNQDKKIHDKEQAIMDKVRGEQKHLRLKSELEMMVASNYVLDETYRVTLIKHIKLSKAEQRLLDDASDIDVQMLHTQIQKTGYRKRANERTAELREKKKEITDFIKNFEKK